jgi:hypothetical protein
MGVAIGYLFSFPMGVAIGYLFFRLETKLSKYSLVGVMAFLFSAFVSRNIAAWMLRYASIQYLTNHTLLSIGVGYVIVSELDWLFGTVYCLQKVDKEVRGFQLQRRGLREGLHAWRNVCAAALIPFISAYFAWGLCGCCINSHGDKTEA